MKNIRNILFNTFPDWPELDLYLNLVFSANGIKVKNKTELHHILPKSIFKEFKNLSKNKWNGVHLSFYDHCLAHYYLACTGNYKLLKAFKAMCSIKTHKLKDSELKFILKMYESKKDEISNAVSNRMKEKWSESEYRISQSQANKNSWTAERIKNHKALMKEVHNRPEVKAKQSESLKKTWENPAFKEKMSLINKEIQSRPDVKLKKSKSLKDRFSAKEYKDKFSKIQKLAWDNDERRILHSKNQKISLNRPEVKAKKEASLRLKHSLPMFGMYDKITLDLIKTFDYIPDAAKFIGQRGTSNISKCLKGERLLAGGYVWKYI